MNTTLLNPVVLAEDYEELVAWYVETFELKVKSQVVEGYSYTELEQSGKPVLGIARASEMGLNPSTPRNNAVLAQLSVSDIEELFDRAKASGARILFGPSRDEKGGFSYGGLADIEGNQIWVVEKK